GGASGVGAKSVPASTPAATATLVGAGTVASCSSSGDEATAAILDATPGTVFNLGDNVYPSGSLTNYQNCYNPSWGRHKARTAPALGNHEYDTSPTAADYFTYFGAAAGDPTKGYYSYDLGAWHVVALNSDVSMSAGSAQEQWLRTDLAAHPLRCTLAYWHHPRFSSGSTHGSMVGSQPLWQALYDAGAEIVLSGHEHNYERFAPQTPGGALDLARGIREFVVGTGGGSGAYPFGTPITNSEVRITGVSGFGSVERITLSGARSRFAAVDAIATAITCGPDGDVWVGVHPAWEIRCYDPLGNLKGAVDVSAVATDLSVFDLAFSPAGEL